MTSDARLERDLTAWFAVDLPVDREEVLTARVEAVLADVRAKAASRPSGFANRRRRAITALIAAAVLIGAAAGPTVREAFDRWADGDFASVWDLATPIDQSVVDQGYRVTLVRAYADPVGLYLAVTMEDLEGRDVSEAHASSARVVDADGFEYPPDLGQSDGTGSSAYSEGLWRYRVPRAAATPGVRHLTAAITSISVRAHDPAEATPGFPYESLWSTVDGSWVFEFDLGFRGQLMTRPGVTASVNGVAITWTGLTVTPAATMVTLEVSGLAPTEPDWGWTHGGRIDHDGHRLEYLYEAGVLDDGPGPQTLVFEMQEGRVDLSGTWRVTIDAFEADVPDPESDVTTEKRVITGPWVLTFEGPPAH